MKEYLILSILLTANIALAQNYQVSDYDQSSNPGQVIKEIKLPPAKTKGNIYLNDDWHFGDFTMKGAGTYEGYMLRYDLKHQNLEIRVDNELKVCVLSLLDDFTFINKTLNQSSHYININSIPSSFVIGHKGIVKVIFNEKIKLYEHYFLEIKEANYSPTTDMGSRDNKILKKKSYYLQANGELYKISNSLKKNKEAFGKNFAKVEIFAKENKLKLKQESDLIEVINYYNSQL